VAESAKINFCEIFGVARFSTFATQSLAKATPMAALLKDKGAPEREAHDHIDCR
jgi:hypothetical protein